LKTTILSASTPGTTAGERMRHPGHLLLVDPLVVLLVVVVLFLGGV
jgi:hypothetical protein